jgi:hypothetical protein
MRKEAVTDVDFEVISDARDYEPPHLPGWTWRDNLNSILKLFWLLVVVVAGKLWAWPALYMVFNHRLPS